MSQPLSTVVNVQITRQTQFIPRAEFNIANIVGDNPIISPNTRILLFNNIAGVAEIFDTTSQEYIAANAYFSQNPSPSVLYISRWINTNIDAQIRTGGRYTTTISTWQSVTAGSFRITIDGTAANVTALNFSAVANLLDVATVIQAGLVTAGFTLATCTYNTTLGLFIINSGVSGSASTITYLSTATASIGTDISGATAGPPWYLDGATGSSSDVIQGMNAESIPDALNAINAANDTWYGLLFTNIVRDDANVIAAAIWTEGQGNLPKLYFTATNDPNTYNPADSTSVAFQLWTLGVFHTAGIYDSVITEYPDAAFMAKDFTYQPGTYTDKFKNISLVTPNDQLTQNQVAVIKSKNCNLYCTVGSAPITQEGVVFGGVGNGEYIDVIRFVDWLQNAITVEVFNLLYSEKKVPYTDGGVTMLIQAVSAGLIESERIGAIAARLDVNDNLLDAFDVYSDPDRVSLVPASQRAARIAPNIVFNTFLAGAVHFVNVQGTVQV